MEWSDIWQRIKAGEDARTELKKSFGDPIDICRTLCAFANGADGLLVLGVDATGGIFGVQEDPEGIQEKLTKFVRADCGRRIIAECDRYRAEEGWVHWVEVHRHQPGREPFYFEGRCWTRIGPRTVEATPSELQDMLNNSGFVFTELLRIPSAAPHHIDAAPFRAFMRMQGKKMDEELQPGIESEFESASVCGRQDGVLRPTLYGLMVFGREPQSHLRMTNLFVKCVSYAGSDRAAAVLSAGESMGRLDEQVNRAMGWFRSLGRTERYRGLHREDIPLVPEELLQEALVNAVIHRDYSQTGSSVMLEVFDDRIDITSPGTLPKHITVEQARSGGVPRSRNEMMANAMIVLRLMGPRGRGWLQMRQAMRAFNGTEPELVNDEEGRFVRVTFRLGDPCRPGARQIIENIDSAA